MVNIMQYRTCGGFFIVIIIFRMNGSFYRIGVHYTDMIHNNNIINASMFVKGVYTSCIVLRSVFFLIGNCHRTKNVLYVSTFGEK